MSARPVIAVHGGAGLHDPAALGACRQACGRAARLGFAHLAAGRTALDAVEAAVNELEDEPLFNAGRGSALNAAGMVEVDASVMVGDTLRAGAVAAVPNLAHPITLARRLMEDGQHVLLVGEGALAFAVEHGIGTDPPDALVTARAVRRYVASLRSGGAVGLDAGNTVGAVARDAAGTVAAATSTGGRSFKRPGRVGDSPLIGCGTYADDRSGAASATGQGEYIIRAVLARAAVDRLAVAENPDEAARAALAELGERLDARAGLILVDARGRIGIAFTTPHMPFAYCDAGGEVVEGS